MTEDSFLEQVARGLVKLSDAQSKVLCAVMGVVYVLLIDCSSSMGTACGDKSRLAAAQSATIDLLNERRRHALEDSVGIIAYNHEANVVLPITPCDEGHLVQISSAIWSMTPWGGTCLRDAFQKAQSLIPTNATVHLIVLTDGHGGDPSPIAGQLKRRGVVIETIGVAKCPAEVDETTLKATASVVDGKVLYRFIGDARTLATYFREEIATRLVKVNRP
jgi:Mg-chelatase subunit ChlD